MTDCAKLFTKEKLFTHGKVDHQKFRRWAQKYHPDKGGPVSLFQKMSNCRDILARKSPKRKSPKRRKSPKTSKPRKTSAKHQKSPKRKPCTTNQIRNPLTNRCIKKSGALYKKLKKENVI